MSLRTLSEAAALIDKGMNNNSDSSTVPPGYPAGVVRSTGLTSNASSTTDEAVFRGNQAAAGSGEPQPVKNSVALFLRKVSEPFARYW